MDFLYYLEPGIVFIALVICVIGIISFAISSLSLMKMAQKKNIENAWLAWIPAGNFFILGKLIKTISIRDKVYENAELILPGAFILYLVVNQVALIGTLASLAFSVLVFYSFYGLFKLYAPTKAKKYMVLSILLPGLGASYALYRIKDIRPL